MADVSLACVSGLLATLCIATGCADIASNDGSLGVLQETLTAPVEGSCEAKAMLVVADGVMRRASRSTDRASA